MASYDDHIAQAKRNLEVLSRVNAAISDTWDWQVTMAFYTAVHLVNAHTARVADMHFSTHYERKTAITPYGLSLCKVPENIYLAYTKLEILSKRARYLCKDHENISEDESKKAFFTYSKHFKRALKNLDTLMMYFSSVYKVRFDKLGIYCPDITTNDKFDFFIPVTSRGEERIEVKDIGK